MKRILSLMACSAILFSCEETAKEKPIENTTVTAEPPKSAPLLSYSLVKTHPHDSTCFTEGYFFHEGQLYESSGAPDHLPATRSMFGIVNPTTGKVEVKGELDRNKYFGEGITILNGKLYQLTWQGQTCFMYDAKSFKPVGQFNYMSKEGWGLTNDGKHLIMSDGTNAITFIDPNTYQVAKTILVADNNYAVDYINELEYINGFIYANVWMTGNIIKIDPESGDVLAKINLNDFVAQAKKRNQSSLEMNGIAYNPESKTLFVTGKMWPTTFEISFQH